MNNDDVSQAFTRIFSTPDGQTVLKDIRARFLDKDMIHAEINAIIQRAAEVEVVRYIEKKINKGKTL